MASIRTTRSGKHEVVWRVKERDGGSGWRWRQKTKSFTKLRDAKAYRAKAELEFEGREVAAGRCPCFADYITHFLDMRLNEGRVPETVEGYLQKLRYVEHHFGDRVLTAITPLMINRALQDIRKGKSHSGRAVSAATVDRVRDVLRNMLNLVVEEQIIQINPVLRTRPIKVPAARHEPPTEEEIKRLLASDLEPKTRAVIEMARFTGARRGEILGLTWGDLDFEERRLGIKRVIERPKEGIRIREGGKTASATRNIIMPAPLVEAMKIWRLRQKEDALRVGLPWSSQCFLFPARDNLHWPVDPDLMTKTIRRAMDRVGVRPEVSPFHGFRHFLGSALMGVVPDKVISEVLGHSTPAITQKLYQQGLESHHRAAAEKTAEVLDFTRKKPHREG